jgi:hypothetical protein
VDDKDIRAYYDPCTLGAQTGPQTIVVRQIIGEQEAQTVLDIHVCVPAAKPAIEQIIDVLVKDVEVNSVNVIHDKVIVRGEFEVKAIYVAQLPNLPVHAVEIKHYRWTQDVDLIGARRGMDADASVIVEFVDYDVDDDWYNRAYKYQKYDDFDEDDCDDEECDPCEPDPCKPKCDPCKPKYDPCKPKYDPCDKECDPCKPKGDPCKPKYDPCDEDDDCEHHHHHHHHHHKHCLREFDVSVVLKVVAKVMADREVYLNNQLPNNQLPNNQVPYNPKG